jgi:hypothetical protein
MFGKRADPLYQVDEQAEVFLSCGILMYQCFELFGIEHSHYGAYASFGIKPM